MRQAVPGLEGPPVRVASGQSCSTYCLACNSRALGSIFLSKHTYTHTHTHTQLVLYLQLFVGHHSQARYAIGGIGTSGLVGILLVSSLGHLFQLDSCCQGVQAIASGSIELHASGSQCRGGIWCDWAHVSVRIAVWFSSFFEQIIEVLSPKGYLLLIQWARDQDFVQWFTGYFVLNLVEAL